MRPKYKFAVIFHFLITITGSPLLKIIDYKFYISPRTLTDFRNQMMPIEEAIEEVSFRLEKVINDTLLSSNPPLRIKFNLILQTDTASLTDLTKCGSSMLELVRLINEFFFFDSSISTIIMLDCGSSFWIEDFNGVGLSLPYVTQTVSTFCPTTTLIFFEPEYDKFSSMFGTALLKAAGIRDPNPLSLEEVTNGDAGKELIFTLKDEAMKQLAESLCFRTD